MFNKKLNLGTTTWRTLSGVLWITDSLGRLRHRTGGFLKKTNTKYT